MLRLAGLFTVLGVGFAIIGMAGNPALQIVDVCLTLALAGVMPWYSWKLPAQLGWYCTALLLSASLIITLMIVTERTWIPSILFMVWLPNCRKLPPKIRNAAYVFPAVVALLVFWLNGILLRDPWSYFTLMPGFFSIIAFSESYRKAKDAIQDSQKLLDELVRTQSELLSSQTQEAEERVHSKLRKDLGLYMVNACVQIEAACRLWATEPSKAGGMANRAGDELRLGLNRLRFEPKAVHSNVNGPVSFVVADQNPEIAKALELVLGMESGLRPCGACSTQQELLTLCTPKQPDIVLLDPSLPGSGLATMCQELVKTGIRIVLSVVIVDSETAKQVLNVAAAGVVAKDELPAKMAEHLIRLAHGAAIESSSPGIKLEKQSSDFSRRDHEVLELIAKGFSNKEIADRLFLAEGTVKNRVSELLQKIGARDRTNAALRARELGLI